MKILQLAPVWETVPPPGYGGTESVIHVLVEELVRRGHEVLLCASGDSTTSAAHHWVVPESLRVAGLTKDSVQYAALHVSTSLRHAAGFDIVHNHNGPPADLGMAMSHSTSTPMLTTLHNQPAADTAFIWRAYTGWYNTISRQQGFGLGPCLPNARFAGMAYNAIDVESFPFNYEKSDYALFMGRISPEKAPHLAIRAARAAGWRMVLAGKVEAPTEVEYFDSVIRPLLNDPLVEYVGEADAVMKRDLYSRAAAQLVPLLWEEPFGLVMVEAMATGTPVIAFARGAARELILDGLTGFLVENEDEMCVALGKVESIDPQRCRDHVEQNFGPSAIADRYLQIYESILGGSEGELGRNASPFAVK